MAINYILDSSKMRIDVVPGDLVTMDVRFLLSAPSQGFVREIGEGVRRAILGVGGENLQIVQVRDGFQRCFYCGRENPNRQKACLFCGEKV